MFWQNTFWVFFEPQIFKNSSGNLTQSRVPLNSLVVKNSTHKSGKILHLSLVLVFSERQINKKFSENRF